MSAVPDKSLTHGPSDVDCWPQPLGLVLQAWALTNGSRRPRWETRRVSRSVM